MRPRTYSIYLNRLAMMSQNHTRHISIISIILKALACAVMLSGCTDDLPYDATAVPDIEVEVRGEVAYRPLVAAEVKTRAGGEAPEGAEYSGIRSLQVFFFNSKEEIVSEYSGDVAFTPSPSDGSTHEHVSFTRKVKAGYYYVFAVANIPESRKGDLAKVANIDDLRNFRLDWDDEIGKDLEMFGVFKIEGQESGDPENEKFEDPVSLRIDRSLSLHSWVRRAASKVTLDFDGTALKDGVTVYIRNAVLKHVAGATRLGAASKVGDEGIGLGTSSYVLTYGAGADYRGWPKVTNKVTEDNPIKPSDVWPGCTLESFHNEAARALPCYENLQGTHDDKSKLQDTDGDGIIDSKDYDGVENGTYLEVEGYYVSDRPEYKSEGKIIYRFMLGKDAVSNFDVVRNHHYKVTMRFKGYGNDIDWHIVYAERYLDATYPEDVDYRGKFFVPSSDYVNIHNAGHDFSDSNVITVTSFETDGKTKTWKAPKITYEYEAYDSETGDWSAATAAADMGWLKLQNKDAEPAEGETGVAYEFKADMTDATTKTTTDMFPTGSEGTKGSPYNLSNSSGAAGIENTANCYIVGAPGWYCFPLVYGNATTGGSDNAAAYLSEHMVNYLGAHISSRYIKEDAALQSAAAGRLSARLVWQDAENLIVPGDIEYVPDMFGSGIGGIRFQIGTIQEGNAVIALIDKDAPESEDDHVNIDRGSVYGHHGSTRAVWSWHIWVTPFGSADYGQDITITNHDRKEYSVMPVNLGWCSGGKAIKYYRRRRCKVKFTVGEHELVRVIEQYPHILLPRGDHPYYQWGRKDPFVGGNKIRGNKLRWIYDETTGTIKKCGEGEDYNPPRLYNEPAQFSDNINREHTKDCLKMLVQNPDKWHNAPRQPLDPEDFTKGFYSTNESYPDLWSNGGSKTVYDPCPAGYQVGDKDVFTGFTTNRENPEGGRAAIPTDWYDVLERDMVAEYYQGESINRQVLAFYTDTRKLQSITFPVTGYRDYDDKALLFRYPNSGEDAAFPNGQGYVWLSEAKDVTESYHLKFFRNDIVSGDLEDWTGRGGNTKNEIAPYEHFYNTDGFAVRPVRSSTE